MTEALKPGDMRLDEDGTTMIFNGFNWLSWKDTLRLIIQSHLRDTMEDLLAEADSDDVPEGEFARTLADIVSYEIFDCALEPMK